MRLFLCTDAAKHLSDEKMVQGFLRQAIALGQNLVHVVGVCEEWRCKSTNEVSPGLSLMSIGLERGADTSVHRGRLFRRARRGCSQNQISEQCAGTGVLRYTGGIATQVG